VKGVLSAEAAVLFELKLPLNPLSVLRRKVRDVFANAAL
jgi:hypothetical protein